LECGGKSSCNALEIEINLPAPPEGYMCDPAVSKPILPISGIECNSDLACQGLDLTINNNGCYKVVIENVDCVQPDSCNAAVFTFNGDVTIQNCHCGPSCGNAVGLDQCYENLEIMLCPDPLSCLGQVQTIVNPVNGFKFICGNVQSCQQGIFTIELNANIKPEPITVFEGFVLGGFNSANGATFIIDNKQGDFSFSGMPILLEVEKIECGGFGSCVGATFVTGDNVQIREVVCAFGACAGCTIKRNVAEPGVPCDPSQTPLPTLPTLPYLPTMPVGPVPVIPVEPIPVIHVEPNPVIPNPVIPVMPVIPSPVIPVIPVEPVPVIPVEPNPVIPNPATPVMPAEPNPATPVMPVEPNPATPFVPFVPIAPV
jgi:hypothetical protein